MSDISASQASANNPIPTLSDLMDNANASWRVFDMGRRITSITKAEFAAVENNSKPYPYPIQQKARFALVFWDQSESNGEAKANPFIWFLQFDVDELGLLKLQQRDHYISLVIKELGSRLLEQGQDKEQSSTLDNHPYSFTPDQNRQAAFNAMVKRALKQPASMYYEHAQAYFSGQVDADKWQDLTVQGIADFAARIDVSDNEQALMRALSELPVQLSSVLAACLEHSEVSYELTKAIISAQNQALDNNDREQVLNLLRCLAGSKSQPMIKMQLTQLLGSKEVEEASLFIVIAGRFWPYLKDKALLHLYLEQAAKHPNQDLFGGLFADLAAVPEVRKEVLSVLRDPTRPEAVSRAIGTVFGHA